MLGQGLSALSIEATRAAVCTLAYVSTCLFEQIYISHLFIVQPCTVGQLPKGEQISQY